MLDYRCDTCEAIAWEGIIQHPEVIGEHKQCCPDCYSEAMIAYPESDDWKTRKKTRLRDVHYAVERCTNEHYPPFFI